MNARCFSINLLKLLENKKNKEILRGGNYDYKMEGINSLLSVEIMNLGVRNTIEKRKIERRLHDFLDYLGG
jgi:hypothetical protein